MPKPINAFKCYKCDRQWQVVDGITTYNKFSFNKLTVDKTKLKVCDICRVEIQNDHTRKTLAGTLVN